MQCRNTLHVHVPENPLFLVAEKCVIHTKCTDFNACIEIGCISYSATQTHEVKCTAPYLLTLQTCAFDVSITYQ